MMASDVILVLPRSDTIISRPSCVERPDFPGNERHPDVRAALRRHNVFGAGTTLTAVFRGENPTLASSVTPRCAGKSGRLASLHRSWLAPLARPARDALVSSAPPPRPGSHALDANLHRGKIGRLSNTAQRACRVGLYRS